MDLLVYLAKSSCLLALFWVIYKIFLETETYHRSKRIFLHLGYVLSLILPLFTFTKIEEIYVEKSSWAIPASFSSEFIQTEIKLSNFELIWSFIIENSLIEILYISISMVFAIYLMVKFFRLIYFLKSSKAFKSEEITYIEKPISEGAFSFLNYIVYDPKLYTEAELKIILAHEKAHMSNKHSIDILFSHLYNCLFWFNPFAWLYQKSLVLNLEYEADDEAVAKTKKRDYQMTLYKATQQQYQSQLQHSFHQSPIKKRIMMLNKNKTQSFWKLFIVSPLLVVFFLLFQVETIAQVKESETTSEAKITKVEITYDENTTREELDSDREFLKEEFNIDLSYSKLRFTSDRKLKSITLDVDCNDGFKGSVTSPDVEKLPVYFYRDFSEDVKKPFGVGTKRDDEQLRSTDPEDFKDVETFIINKQKLNKSDLINSYIPVKQYTHMEDSNTLYITTRSEFSKPYYDGMFEAKDELNAIFEKGEPEGVVYFKVEEDNVIIMTINNFKISGSAENASQHHNSTLNYSNKFPNQNIVFILDGLEIGESQINTIEPDKIKSVTVIKDSNQLKEEGYDPEEVDGLIKIIKKTNDNINSSQPENAYMKFRGELNSLGGKLIYKVDEKEVDEEEFYKLKPEQVKSMVIIKSPDNLKRNGYDPKKIDGVIQISTKKGDSKGDEKIKIK